MDDFRLLLPDDHGIIGTLDEQGVLSFVVGVAEGSPIRGTEMFDLMIRAFGPRVRAIAGVWRRGFQGKKSVNIDKVNELTATGISLEESVRGTWTATRAARWGFTKVSIIQSPTGVPGSFTKIDVLMERSTDPS